MSTIIISILLLVLAIFVIKKMRKDKNTNKHSCGGGCSGCASASSCRQAKSHK